MLNMTFRMLIVLIAIASVPKLSDAARCGFVSISDLDFGEYDVFGGPLDSAFTITYRCTQVRDNDRIEMEIRRSRGSFDPRQMRFRGNRLDYNVYLDAARSIVWGNGRNGTGSYGPVQPPGNTNVSIQAYGRIFSGQDVTMGDYEDTLRIAIRY